MLIYTCKQETIAETDYCRVGIDTAREESRTGFADLPQNFGFTRNRLAFVLVGRWTTVTLNLALLGFEDNQSFCVNGGFLHEG